MGRLRGIQVSVILREIPQAQVKTLKSNQVLDKFTIPNIRIFANFNRRDEGYEDVESNDERLDIPPEFR